MRVHIAFTIKVNSAVPPPASDKAFNWATVTGEGL
jgi:hypothetical protein